MSEVLAIAAAGQVRSWREALMPRGGLRGYHEEPQSPRIGEGSAQSGVGVVSLSGTEGGLQGQKHFAS